MLELQTRNKVSKSSKLQRMKKEDYKPQLRLLKLHPANFLVVDPASNSNRISSKHSSPKTSFFSRTSRFHNTRLQDFKLQLQLNNLSISCLRWPHLHQLIVLIICSSTLIFRSVMLQFLTCLPLFCQLSKINSALTSQPRWS